MGPRPISMLPPSTYVDFFIQTEVQASHGFVLAAQIAIDVLVRILHRCCGYNVAEVFKTGSFGQGTALSSNLSDIDLVIYFNQQTVESLRVNIKQILTNIHTTLLIAGLPGYRYIYMDEFRLQIQLEAQGCSFKVDLLPGITGPRDEMYRKMYQTKDPVIREHYSVTFAKLQRDFIQARETKLKSLFQLMKYWSKVDLQFFVNQKVPSYLMSLIVIYTWEKYGKPQNFETEIGFKAVLTTLVNYKQIEKVWFENYDSATWQCFGVPNSPYMIDPANPSANVLNIENWNEIARAAQYTIDSPLLRSIVVSANWL